MKYIIDLPDTCQWVQWINLSDKDGHAYFDFKSPEDLTPLDKELSEAYQKGLDDGKARNESRCLGCRYDNGRIDHSPCDYCCNAYSNQWSAKSCSDEIDVGDEVESLSTGLVYIIHEIDGNYVKGYNFKSRHTCGDKNDYKKTGRHFPQVAELLKAMKGEQRDCHTCKHQVTSSIECVDCRGFGKWEPKEGAE